MAWHVACEQPSRVPLAKKRREAAMTLRARSGRSFHARCAELPVEIGGSLTPGWGARVARFIVRHQISCGLTVTVIVTWLVLSW
jgi:hypothetical protein